MNAILFDDHQVWQQLKPLTWTRSITDIRIGILTVAEKWRLHLKADIAVNTLGYLQARYKTHSEPSALHIASHCLPNSALVEALHKLKSGEKLMLQTQLIAYRLPPGGSLESCSSVQFDGAITTVTRTWDIFRKNGEEIEADFAILTKNRLSEKVPDSVQIIGDRSKVFLEKGASIECAILNTKAGSIYLAADSEVMEGSVVRGPFSLGEHSALKLATKIYGPTTIGPHSKVGGEVNNCVIFGYSNKAHDGFIGNSVIGEWCNLGADTNSSNLKNNYANVKIHDYVSGKALDSGLQFCGLIMGDHSKSGINTMFNTGTVVGVGCNVFGGGFPPQFIPEFSWCNGSDLSHYKLEKLFETAEKVWQRRGLVFDEKEKQLLTHIHQLAIA
jgi:UDP-N-acetylglucosamine diphosphorylase/glucosamine-1-phosphate N-acetyltransferase